MNLAIRDGSARMARFETWYMAGGHARPAAARGGAIQFESSAEPGSADRTRIAASLVIAASVIYAISQTQAYIVIRERRLSASRNSRQPGKRPGRGASPAVSLGPEGPSPLPASQSQIAAAMVELSGM